MLLMKRVINKLMVVVYKTGVEKNSKTQERREGGIKEVWIDVGKKSRRAGASRKKDEEKQDEQDRQREQGERETMEGGKIDEYST